jgi:hypothetical protein
MKKIYLQAYANAKDHKLQCYFVRISKLAASSLSRRIAGNSGVTGIICFRNNETAILSIFCFLQAYANAKAALAKKLPASLLRAGGGTKMVRIGPGGIVRAESGRIVTTIDPSPLLKSALGTSSSSIGSRNGSSTTSGNTISSSSSRQVEKKLEDDDDDDDLSCHLCLSSFWYKNELLEHLKESITMDYRFKSCVAHIHSFPTCLIGFIWPSTSFFSTVPSNV